MTDLPSQSEVCREFGSAFCPLDEDDCVGIALITLTRTPLNALRHNAENGTSGWYIWGGEYSDDPAFFQPLHAHHLVGHAPALVPYLALAPGWRVLLAPGHKDIWYDPTLLAA